MTFFNAIVSHYQAGAAEWLSKPFVQSAFYARVRADRVYKVAKVQEFTRSKSRGIKIKNSGSYQPPRHRAAYI